jgi:3-oxoadipate enol-lactonase
MFPQEGQYEMNQTAQTQAGFVEVTGGRLPYEVAGEGHPFLLIHAGVADKSMWDPQWDEFAQHFRVIRYDTRGFGGFKTEDVAFSNRQDIVDLLDHLGLQSAYIMGCSRGGQIAVDFTIEFPERVDALISVAGGMSGYEPTPNEGNAEEWRLFDEMEAIYELGDFERLTELDVQMWIDGIGQSPDRVDPQLRERMHEIIASNYREHPTQGQPIVLDPPAFGRLAEIQVPTLVLIGDLDTYETQQMSNILAEKIPGARKAVIHGTAHLPNMEKPDEFTRLVLDFLNEVEQRTAS